MSYDHTHAFTAESGGVQTISTLRPNIGQKSENTPAQRRYVSAAESLAPKFEFEVIPSLFYPDMSAHPQESGVKVVTEESQHKEGL